MTDLDQLSAAATQGEWHVGHFANPEVRCDCRYIFAGDFMGAFACVYEGGGEDDNPPEDQQIASAKYIVTLINKHRSGDLIPLAAHEAAIKAAVLAERERGASICDRGDIKYASSAVEHIRNPEATP